MSANKTAKFKIESNNVPTVSATQRKRLAAVSAMPDAAIDYTDMPQQTATDKVVWTRPGLLAPAENNQQITLRVDAEVLRFFKGTGRCHQTRINAALREYVNAHRKAD